MPSKNVVKEYVADAYYHVYNRGVEKRKIFLDSEDYTVFLGLLKKYLAGENHNKNNRHAFSKLDTDVALLSYCLMPNHFHLLLYQYSEEGITKLMRRINTGYVMYFNQKYDRVGRLFQGTYKASHVNADAYLQHISRYIHLNPADYKNWPYSSLVYYQGAKKAKWLHPEMILDMFDSRQEYLEFVDDLAAAKQEITLLQHQLAAGIDD